jgi:hypothetical protein
MSSPSRAARLVRDARADWLPVTATIEEVAEQQAATARRCEALGDVRGAVVFRERARRAGRMAVILRARQEARDAAAWGRGQRTARTA